MPRNLGLQFQRGLSDGDWDLEERATKKSGRAEAVSVHKGPVPAATMEIPAQRRDTWVSSASRKHTSLPTERRRSQPTPRHRGRSRRRPPT